MKLGERLLVTKEERREMVFEYLRKHPKSNAFDVRDGVGLKMDLVRGALSTLTKQGKICSKQVGAYNEYWITSHRENLQQRINVCSRCLTHTCVKGELMCWDAQGADIIEKTRDELLSLNLEHPSHWPEVKNEPTRTS